MLIDYRIRQREYLLAISRALTAELDLSDVLRIIVRACVEFMSGRAGIIALANSDERTYRIAAVYGIQPEKLHHFAPLLQELPYEEGVEHKAIPNLRRQMRQVAQEANLNFNQALRLPMRNGNRVIGLIYIFQTENYPFTSESATLVQSFADQAAIAVKNAVLYQDILSEKQRLAAILEQSADGVMILSPTLKITVFNRALSRMTGWAASDAIGQPFASIIQWDQLQTEIDLIHALKNGWLDAPESPLYVEGNLKQKSGPIISLGITYTARLDNEGALADVIANVRDLTHIRQEQELQKTFISVISHELKTPVSIIKGYAGTLQRADANWSPEVQKEYLEVIEDEADQLTDLIDNLLEASRLQSGSFKLEINDGVSLPNIANLITRKFNGQTEKHQILSSIPKDFPYVYGDDRRLTQVFNNLVSNAMKYSPNGGQITLSAIEKDGTVEISVADQGVGIPEHERHRIFKKFSRLDNALSRKTEGTGLGLFLTKAIIEAHGGHIWFNSNDSNQGTTFTFTLPKVE